MGGYIATGGVGRKKKRRKYAIGPGNGALWSNRAVANWRPSRIRSLCFEISHVFSNQASLRARRIAERFLTLKASALYNLGRYEEAAACARDATRGPTAAARIDDLGGFAKWPYNQNCSTTTLARIAEGLRKAALPDQRPDSL